MINPRLVKAWSFESQFEGGGDAVFLVDNTLRDGDQTAGVVFAATEKIRIARLLSELGVHEMETGSPWLCPEEREAMAEISSLGLSTKCLAFCRADPRDIVLAKECGVDGVVISSSTSRIHIEKKYGKSRKWVLDRVREAAEAAKDMGLPFIVSAEDASRTNMEFLPLVSASATLWPFLTLSPPSSRCRRSSRRSTLTSKSIVITTSAWPPPTASPGIGQVRAISRCR
jgi:hypothetical protein